MDTLIVWFIILIPPAMIAGAGIYSWKQAVEYHRKSREELRNRK